MPSTQLIALYYIILYYVMSCHVMSFHVISYIILYYIILYKCVATCCDQFKGHPQATRRHKSRVKIASFILGQNVTQCILITLKKLL